MGDAHYDTRARLRAAVAALAVPCLLAGGCVVHVQHAARSALLSTNPADAHLDTPEPEAPAPGADLPWPGRWGQESGLRGVILPLEGPLSVWHGVWLGEHHFLRAADAEYADAAALGEALGAPAGFRFRTEGPGSFIFTRDRAYEGPDAPPLPEPTPTDPAFLFKHVSGTVTQTWDKVPGVELQRTWFGLYDPTGSQEPRGTVLVIPGMFGTPEPVIESLVLSMRQRGWSVLRMLSHPSRFTERLEMPVDPAHPEMAAEELAEVLTDRAAECAYAAEAALLHARTLRPELGGLPTVLMGMSGGAIALPTVHALNPGLYDAAVVIAGGVNFLRINIESNYADFIDSIHLDWNADAPGLGKPSRSAAEALTAAYLEHALLDGAHTARLLAEKPVLIIHASRDRAVPSHLGDTLWELSGRPERWTMPLGHELLFLALPTQAGRIDEWLSANVPAATGGAGGP